MLGQIDGAPSPGNPTHHALVSLQQRPNVDMPVARASTAEACESTCRGKRPARDVPGHASRPGRLPERSAPIRREADGSYKPDGHGNGITRRPLATPATCWPLHTGAASLRVWPQSCPATGSMPASPRRLARRTPGQRLDRCLCLRGIRPGCHRGHFRWRRLSRCLDPWKAERGDQPDTTLQLQKSRVRS
jgi:hypothetical protein